MKKDSNVKLLSVVVPVRLDSDRYDLLMRLEFIRLDESSRFVDILVVDDGSLEPEASTLRARCAELGYKYVSTGVYNRTFSIGRARNLGAQTARTPFVMFQDVDLMPCEGFYDGALREVQVQGLTEFAERFLMFGVIYLSSAATQEFAACDPQLRRSQFTQYLLDNDGEKIEKFSTGTSVIVVSREYFLGCGGMDADFEGWGFEDLEFTCRMLRRNKRFPLPADFERDYRNFNSIQEYKGWKSTYRLFGDTTFMKGLVLFHAWHPVYSDSSYMAARTRNQRMFQEKLAAFKTAQLEPPPLPKPERGRTLVFRNNTFVLNRWVTPAWGQVCLVSETDFSPPTLIDFIKNRAIDRVVFHNPFANDEMGHLFEAVRQAGIEYVVCERGALPNSTFFDPRGFNGQSSSYDPVYWDKPLDAEQKRSTLNYIRDLVVGGASLEEQPDRIGVEATRRRLGLGPGEKVLLVGLQRPTDTVITRLAGPIQTYPRFLELLRQTSEELPPDWKMVVKRHPLESEVPDLPNATWANQSHIHDLLDVADAVLVINSGVGVLALAHEKPVLVAGDAFYNHPGLSTQVIESQDVLAALESFRPDKEKILRFLRYLVFEFYSFGEFKTRNVAWTDGSRMTATVDIDYQVLRIPGQPEIRYQRRRDVEVAEGSILFDRYRKPNGELMRDTPAPSTPRLAQPSIGASSGKAPPSVGRKIRKLRADPRGFLEDSQFSSLRSLGKLLG